MEISVNGFQFIDNSPEVLAALESAVELALTECGMTAEGYAKDLCPVNTGNLRNSITFEVDAGSKECTIGSGVEYAPYVELGTGKYVSGGSTPWVYQDDQGNWHRTSGQPPKAFIKPSVADHEGEYHSIIERHLKG